VRRGDRSQRYEVLIDSGADISVFSYQLGEYLGLDPTTGVHSELVGVTGEPEDFYICPIEIVIGPLTLRTRAGFLRSMDDKPYGVVGQDGFFDLFDVAFKLSKEEIELTPAA